MQKHILVGALAALAASLANAQTYYGPGMMWGDGWAMHGFMHLLWWGLAACVVVWLLRRPYGGHCHHHGHYGEDRALAILRERYARGEIDKTEFEARKADLVG